MRPAGSGVLIGGGLRGSAGTIVKVAADRFGKDSRPHGTPMRDQELRDGLARLAGEFDRIAVPDPGRYVR